MAKIGNVTATEYLIDASQMSKHCLLLASFNTEQIESDVEGRPIARLKSIKLGLTACASEASLFIYF